MGVVVPTASDPIVPLTPLSPLLASPRAHPPSRVLPRALLLVERAVVRVKEPPDSSLRRLVKEDASSEPGVPSIGRDPS